MVAEKQEIAPFQAEIRPTRGVHDAKYRIVVGVVNTGQVLVDHQLHVGQAQAAHLLVDLGSRGQLEVALIVVELQRESLFQRGDILYGHAQAQKLDAVELEVCFCEIESGLWC